MTRIILPLVLIAISGGIIGAAEPTTADPPTRTRPRVATSSGSYFERAAAAAEKKRELIRSAVECLAVPQPDVSLFILALIDPPSYRMSRLLIESEDLSKARDEWHRFWMNNPPSVFTHDRLKGAIGP
jgi:hypothetical protein